MLETFRSFLTRSSVFPLFALGFFAALIGTAAEASEQKVSVGDYEMHYNVFPSALLTPEVARQYNLTRSRAIGIVNVAVLKKPESASELAMPVRSLVQGQVTNDLRQVRQLQFKTIQDGDSIYYIAQFQHQNAELLTFNLEARPQGSEVSLAVRVSKKLFSDNE